MGKLYKVVRSMARLYYRTFFRIEVVGMENVDPEAHYVVCGNHINIQDPFVMACILPFQTHFMAKKESFKYKIVAWFLDSIGTFPVDRDANDLKAIKTALSILKRDETLGLFPEGTRNKGYKPLPVKSGVTMMAIKTKTPILPMTIDTTYKFFSPMKITIHKPIAYEAYYGQKVDSDTLEVLATDLMNQIYNTLEYYVPKG